jgi:hypothetical protein
MAAIALRGRDHRPDVRRGVAGVAQAPRLEGGAERVDCAIINFAVDQKTGLGAADLAIILQHCADELRHDRGKVDVVEQDRGGFAAELQRAAREAANLQAETLCRLGRVARSRGIDRRSRDGGRLHVDEPPLL